MTLLIGLLIAIVLLVVLGVDLTVTAANVKPVAGSTVYYQPNKPTLAGVAITAGQVVYIAGDGTAKLAKANTGTAPAPWPESVVAGIAMNPAAIGQPVLIATGGQINIGAVTVQGQTYVCSPNNAGGVAPVADLLAAQTPVQYVSYLGQAVNAAGLFNLAINNTGINE